jgi:hypothetical protein
MYFLVGYMAVNRQELLDSKSKLLHSNDLLLFAIHLMRAIWFRQYNFLLVFLLQVGHSMTELWNPDLFHGESSRNIEK